MASIPSAAQALRAGLLRRSGCPRLHLRLAQDGKEEADDAIGEDDPRRDERGADERDDGLSAQATASAQPVSSASRSQSCRKSRSRRKRTVARPAQLLSTTTHAETAEPPQVQRLRCTPFTSQATCRHGGSPSSLPFGPIPHNPDRQLWSTAATAIAVRLRGQATPSHANSSSWAIPVSFCLQWG